MPLKPRALAQKADVTRLRISQSKTVSPVLTAEDRHRNAPQQIFLNNRRAHATAVRIAPNLRLTLVTEVKAHDLASVQRHAPCCHPSPATGPAGHGFGSQGRTSGLGCSDGLAARLRGTAKHPKQVLRLCIDVSGAAQRPRPAPCPLAWSTHQRLFSQAPRCGARAMAQDCFTCCSQSPLQSVLPHT